MQLTPPSAVTGPTLRRALAAATASLLALPAANAEEDQLTTVDSGLLYYRESDRIQAIEPVLDVGYRIDDERKLTFGLTADALTGATPLGAVPSSQPQTFVRPYGIVTVGGPQTATTASGGRVLVVIPGAPGATTQVVASTQTVAANEYPLDRGFKDHRFSGHVGWEQSLFDTLELNVGAAFSREQDYRSASANAGLAWDFNAHNTTLNLGGNFESDSSFPVGGTPTPLQVMSADWKGSSRSRREVDALLGITQVLNRRWISTLSYSVGRSHGYQTDPYRIISVVDSVSGNPTSQLYESRPESRRKRSLFLDNKINVLGDVLDLSARAYKDDWGISSVTFDARLRVDIASGYYIEPHLRYYRQHQADFFQYYLVQGAALPQFASSDTRLGEFHANTVGLKFGMKLDRGSEVNFRLERYIQSGDGHPAGAIGQLQQQNLFPELKGATVLIGYTYAF